MDFKVEKVTHHAGGAATRPGNVQKGEDIECYVGAMGSWSELPHILIGSRMSERYKDLDDAFFY